MLSAMLAYIRNLVYQKRTLAFEAIPRHSIGIMLYLYHQNKGEYFNESNEGNAEKGQGFYEGL